MKRTTQVVIAAIGAVVLLSGFGPGRFGCGGTPEERFDRGASFAADRLTSKLNDLDATHEQHAHAQRLLEQLAADAKPVMLSNRQVHRDFATQFMAEQLDAQTLHALVDARAEAYRALAHRAVDAAAEFHGTLTPAQKEELRAQLQERLDELE